MASRKVSAKVRIYFVFTNMATDGGSIILNLNCLHQLIRDLIKESGKYLIELLNLFLLTYS
jgi:hypothetical protein